MKLDHICQAMKKANIYPNFIQPILPYIRDWYHLQVHEPGILSLTTYFHVKAIGTNIYRYICPSTKPFLYHTSIIMSSNEESGIKPADPYPYIPHFRELFWKNKTKCLVNLLCFSELGSKKSEAIVAETRLPLVSIYLNQGKSVLYRWEVRGKY